MKAFLRRAGALTLWAKLIFSDFDPKTMREGQLHYPPLIGIAALIAVPFAWAKRLFDDHEFELQLFAAADQAQVELPELARKSKARPTLIEVDEQLQTNRPPNIRE